MIKKLTSNWLVALGCLVAFSMAMAAVSAPCSRIVELTSKSIAAGVGVTWGDGTLTMAGKKYPFWVEGLSVGDLGVSDVKAVGDVFNLKNVDDFSGVYASGEAGFALDKGQNDLILKNTKGVVLRLKGTQQGVRLTLAAGGVKLTIKNSM